MFFGSRCTLQKLTMESPVCNHLQADGVPRAKTRCFHFAALQFQAARRLLSQNAQIYEPKCHCCGAYLKPLCQEAERLLIVEIKIMFSDICTD